jgi:hypothetical protein
LKYGQKSGKVSMTPTIYQLKVVLEGIKPQIWRRLQTKDCTLPNFHEIIQVGFGWENYHMYVFQIGGDEYSDPRMIGDLPWKNAKKMKLSQAVEAGNKEFGYTYDMGDDWQHSITVEKTLAPEPKVKYPRCIDGARACPPEDCGGIGGYEEFLEAISNPKHEDHEEMLEWIGGDFDPEEFSAKEVAKRMRRG